MEVLLWIWTAATAVVIFIWSSRHLQIAAANRLMPPLKSSMYDNANKALPSISLLVAAKDEEANIGACLRSLLSQNYPEYEVIAINDRSTDRTRQIMDSIASEHKRLTALHVRELREGWFGKNNAMHEGVSRAKGEWLCFTDADCVFKSPRTLRVALRFAQEKGADFISVLPSHETNSFWERVIQPACSAILLIWFHPLRVNDPKNPTAYANGAFMLMRRSCYDKIGGHEQVKDEVNEDMHLAVLTKKAGQRLAVVSNEDLYSVRMYDSLASAWTGWTRIFFGCFRTLRRLILSIILLTNVSLLPWAAFASGMLVSSLVPTANPAWHWLGWIGMAACAAQLSVMVRFYALSKLHPAYGLFYPLGAVIGLGILLNAIRRVGGHRSIIWKGTTYQGNQIAPTTENTPPAHG